MRKPVVVDLFSGAGGLTHGFYLEGFEVAAGIDFDAACKYGYEANNGDARFIHKDIREVTGQEIRDLYPEGCIKVLVGCAPCQPFSSYARKVKNKDENKWRLLEEFARLVVEVAPDIVSMENVRYLENFNKGEMLNYFTGVLYNQGYQVEVNPKVSCASYGVPQLRTRLVLLASKLGPITLVPGTYGPERYRTVRDVIGGLPPLIAGGVDPNDPTHRTNGLTETNMKRMQASLPGGTWEDWDESLLAACHQKENGKSFKSVYGRMSWDKVAPTITTQCYGFGNGRFGHPEQDRAISLREAALLQTFPRSYQFVETEKPCHVSELSRLIGNAVPVELGRAIARSIRSHLRQFAPTGERIPGTA